MIDVTGNFARRQFILSGAVWASVVLGLAACGSNLRKSDDDGPVEVAVEAGRIRGTTETGVGVFRGIPYAAAPTGDLRFKAPVPARAWQGVRDANRFGPMPPAGDPQRNEPSLDVGITNGGDEWLTLNVWTTNAGGSRPDLPVLVWIHGGGYTTGTSADARYNGAALAKRGVVVVTCNYRVGVEGFAQISGAPANRGLLDQIEVLRWVRDNISVFGGDPGNVTIFGQSAGAGSIACLLTSPLARGLYRRAIAESVPGDLFSGALAEEIGGAIAQQLGVRPSIEELARFAPAALAEAARSTRRDQWGARAVMTTGFAPVIDSVSLPESPWRALARGVARDVPLIVGHTQHEYNSQILQKGGFGAVSATDVDEVLGLVPGGADAYRRGYPELDDAHLYEVASSDLIFRMPSLHLAQAHTGAGGTTYLYEFLYNTKGAGSGHMAELPLVFGTVESSAAGVALYGKPAPDSALSLAEEIQSRWVSFARGGDPGWPAYTPAEKLTRNFDAASSTGRYRETVSDDIWNGTNFDPIVIES
ncbi:carboxylesterase/lipase family protein [Tsukamurella paurometabola]|uniref:carboxylesterase/lipase family protein n=1 Tax=Tsukamurella paurometabola TaxID=2061 RepID=UPI00019F0F6B|nr:carboxylesterase family protein [Tsukamurella paurometabola]